MSESTGNKCGISYHVDGLWLSYIIPLYNCGEYIAKCLDSVLAQGLDSAEYEVIVVNDGSTDNGGEVVARYCQKYDNIRLVNKENGGVSSARNRGIDEAHGEYIYFMDADDYLLPGGMKILRDEYLNKYGHADVISFWCHTVDKHYERQKWEHIRPHKSYFQGTFLEYGNKYGIDCFVYTRIISREFIIGSNVRFPSYVISEDVMFMILLFCYKDAVIIATNLDIYRYCVRESSAMTRIDSDHIERYLNSVVDYMNQLQELQTTSPYNKDIFDVKIKSSQRHTFTRICSVRGYRNVKNFLNKARQANFYPIKQADTPIYKFINKVYNKPLLVYILSLPFRYIFIPYIKPYIRRN